MIVVRRPSKLGFRWFEESNAFADVAPTILLDHSWQCGAKEVYSRARGRPDLCSMLGRILLTSLSLSFFMISTFVGLQYDHKVQFDLVGMSDPDTGCGG